MVPPVSARPTLLRLLNRNVALACVLVGLALLAGCVRRSDPVAPRSTTLEGRVVYSDDVNRGVPAVLVRALGKSAVATTDSAGRFNFEISVADGEFLQVTLSKPGFAEAVTSLTVRSGQPNALPATIALVRLGSGGGGGASGAASSVVMKSISAASIGVTHSGSSETALITFEVRDAQGRPVDFGHRATLQFGLNQRVGGGAYISPDTLSTDESGLAVVALNAGTLAQAVQVRAQVYGTGIVSFPVPVAIHGGLPNAQHFSFAVEKLNVEGLVEFGIIDKVTAFVGDRYGNPVPAGQVVYFSTRGVLIQGSATTDDHGRASVDLLTAEPLPNNTPAFADSSGIARVSAQTMDENQNAITNSALAVLFSGHTEVSISPGTFSIPAEGSQDFTVTVRDREHHNPLVGGSVITFAASQGAVAGTASIVLPDTQDDAYTTFTFRLENSAAGPALIGPNRARIPLTAVRSGSSDVRLASAAGGPVVDVPGPATVTVAVTSPNGNARASVSGTIDHP